MIGFNVTLLFLVCVVGKINKDDDQKYGNKCKNQYYIIPDVIIFVQHVGIYFLNWQVSL